MQQVALHTELMKKEFGVAPTAFRNTELIYSDRIGSDVAEMGFKTCWPREPDTYWDGSRPAMFMPMRSTSA